MSNKLSVCFRIILEAAYSLHDRTFADNVGTVLLYAVVVSGVSTGMRKLLPTYFNITDDVFLP